MSEIAVHIILDGEEINLWEFNANYIDVYEDILGLIEANGWF